MYKQAKFIKERPRCRKMIKELLEEHSMTRLEDMACGYFFDCGKKIFITDGLRKQAIKMLHESTS